MSIDHEPGKARQLETASSSGAVLESDEALARRLHEELNALTRHSRRGPAAAGQQQQLQRSRSEKLPDSKAAAAGHTKPSASKQQRVQSDAEAQLGCMVHQQQRDGSDKQQPGRKRSILNRELAMLVTDMVDSQLKPATGPRQTKSKDEQVADQHKGSSELLASVEQLLPILKHESSSSQSEQERLALEHVQAAVADGTPQAKQAQQRQQHFAARASDSGADLAAGDSGCISGAESSGRDSSNSSGERDRGQQHTSPAAADQSIEQQQQQQQAPRGRHAQAAPTQAATGKGKQQQQQDAAAGGGSTVKMIKIPKLPMVEYAKKWYRAKVLKDTGPKVLLEYQGCSHEGGPFWLPKDHARIWRGSYKGRDWKYLGDGAWEPKTSNKSEEGKVRRAKTHRSSSAAAAAATAAGDGGAAADSDTEQLVGRQQRRGQVQQQHRQKKQKQPHRRGAAAADSLKQEGEGGRADGGAVSERDTTSADQQGEAAGDADAAGPSAAEQGEVDSGMQLDEPCKREEEGEPGEEQQQLDEQACGADLTGAAAMETDQQQDGQAELGHQQQQPGAAADAVQGEDCKQQVQQLQADEQPDMLVGAEQCNKVALIRSASSRAAEAAAEAAAAAAAASVKQETVDAAEAAAAMAPAHAAALAAAVQAQPAADAAKRSSLPGTSPLLMGHTHEEMVAAAAAAVAVAAPPAPRGRGARSGRSNSARSNGDGISEGTSRRGRGGKGGRGRGAAAAARAAAAAAAAAAADAAAFQEQQANHDMLQQQQQQQQQFQQAQQPAASGSASGSGQLPGNLRVEPGRALKHSGSSEGPLSPTSPSGGSPKANSRRRKGVPRRARLDSEDLQRPTKRVRGAPKPSAYCETAMEWQQHEQQVQRQHMLEQQRQAAQLAAQQQQAAWKAAGRGGGGGYGAGSSASSAKKSMWQMQQPGEFAVSAREQVRQQQAYWQQEQQQVWAQALPSPRQQTLAAAAAAAAAAECQVAVAEHQQALLLQQTQMQGSEPEDVEAARVLLGAAMGRAHSGEVATGLVDSQAAGYTQHGLAAAAQRSFSLTAADESMQLSPRFAGVGRQGAKRRGHNWSKQLSSNTSRPPRPPAPGQQQGPSSTAGFRQSLNGSSSLPQPQRRISFSNAELGMDGVEQQQQQQQQQQHSYGGVASGGMLKGRNGSCAGSNGKADTLRTLLDAVGQVQSSSGRPDLMFPMQFGGVPMGTQAPGKNGRNGAVQPLQLLHTPVSAAAATLLAAVPSLDAVQRMAVLQGQGGVLACLTGEPPSLFL